MSIDYNKVLFLQYDKIKGAWRDITSEISAYRLESNACRVQYVSSAQWYPKSYRDVRILQDPQKVDIDNVVVFCNGTALTNVRYVLRFDNWYKAFFENGRVSSYEASKVSFKENKNKEPEIKRLLDYLLEVARYISVEEGHDFLANQLDSLFISEESAFSKLINRTISHKEYNNIVIFPFSTNASQQKAVKIAMEDDLSLIQGPPGTGKTQTILNIIANMIVQGKSVAVVSGNNEATKNVFQKIDAAGYGYINAFLGRKENITAFFEGNQSGVPTFTSTEYSKDDFASQSNLLKEGYLKKLKQAENAQLISELETEKAINDAEYHLRERVIPKSLLKKNYTSKKLLELSSILQCVSQEQYNRFFTRVRLLFRFGIIRTKEILNNPYDIIEYLENQYYIAKIAELAEENEKINAFLKVNNFEALLGDFTQYSKKVLENALASRFSKPFGEFTETNYRYRFDAFVRRYPVVYSTTHAIASCSGKHYLYDCIIIDEASQVDLVTAAIALCCAKKVVLVGDEKQLPHVIKGSHISTLNHIFKTSGLDECFDYVHNNILGCVKKLVPTVADTLLREHYRCDPEIIGFCNKRFYNGKLVVIKSHKPNCGVSIITHPAHLARGRINERQVEIIDRELMPELIPDKTGIVAPYRDQVALLQNRFGKTGMLIDTVHKFQGKECDTVIMSTVANKVKFYEDEEKIDFLNNPHLINVAISRAINKLYILASHEILEQEGSLLRDMSKYCEYYCSETKILQTAVYSVFDLMYDDYSPILGEMKKRILNISEFTSENIIATVIQDICESGECGALSYKFNYPLRAVIKTTSLTDYDDIKFVRNINTHCDFVIYNTLDKKIELVVEVDGSQHQESVQFARDRRKDRLLQGAKIKMLRLPTTSMDCKEKIIAALPKKDS